MPELPEIEALCRRLRPHLTGIRVAHLEVRDPKLWLPDGGLNAHHLGALTVNAISRRAKLLLFELSGGATVLVHLKVAGQIVYRSPSGLTISGGFPYDFSSAGARVSPPERIARLVLHFTDGASLTLNDRRRFAWMRLLPSAQVRTYLDGKRYGPDPLDPSFTASLLASRLRGRTKKPIKAALLDQTCIAGIGSIYADEALHRARIHPAAPAGTLTERQFASLHTGIGDVLATAIGAGGAIVLGTRAVLHSASGRDFLRVHGRAGQPCTTCSSASQPPTDSLPGAAITSTTVAGRSSYYCPACQP